MTPQRTRKKPTINTLSETPPKPVNDSYGRQFVKEHVDAEIEFYWAIKATVELPKNRVLMGMTQNLQEMLNNNLLLAVFRRGFLEINNLNRNFQDLCNRSLNNPIIIDQYGSHYTGKQFLDIMLHAKHDF